TTAPSSRLNTTNTTHERIGGQTPPVLSSTRPLRSRSTSLCTRAGLGSAAAPLGIADGLEDLARLRRTGLEHGGDQQQRGEYQQDGPELCHRVFSSQCGQGQDRERPRRLGAPTTAFGVTDGLGALAGLRRGRVEYRP